MSDHDHQGLRHSALRTGLVWGEPRLSEQEFVVEEGLVVCGTFSSVDRNYRLSLRHLLPFSSRTATISPIQTPSGNYSQSIVVALHLLPV